MQKRYFDIFKRQKARHFLEKEDECKLIDYSDDDWAGYTTVNEASCQAVWLRRLLDDLQLKQAKSSIFLCDNKSAISMTKDSVFHARSKNIELRHHFVRDLVGKEEIGFYYINTSEQPSDILTKPDSFEKIID